MRPARVRFPPGGITLRSQDPDGKGSNGIEARKDDTVIASRRAPSW